MSDQQKIFRFASFDRLVARLRDDFHSGGQDYLLLYAYNGTGKTRLSMAFKSAGKAKHGGAPDTLYFNAYTEDLFIWDNDLQGDTKRVLRLNSDSRFFAGLKELALDASIQSYLGRYTDLDFDIDYTDLTVSFRKGEAEHIKVSRGEENIFVWCLFMAICERVIDSHPSYDWVKYFYIDDPISSLDDNNAIAVASDLAKLLRKAKDRIKVVVSSHHALFFNVVCNELKTAKAKRYFLHRPRDNGEFTLRATDDTPFFHHVAMLSEIRQAADSGALYTYHFNMLRSILEKTATFFGKKDFSACLEGVEDEALYSRALNLLSHGKYSLYEPIEMLEDNKQLFRDILSAFLSKHQFDLPALLNENAAAQPQAALPEAMSEEVQAP
ncbi:AAA family ATPase [Chitinivorax sp. B]|uniref:AAA family ATPase n=1 Tax=Chitinivorax sp. B TaxID=2502235 RepID=UPI0010F5FCBE|nr:AAA family ATPase [Chitinivorax sp. B]